MSDLAERIIKSTIRTEQLKRQKKALEIRERRRKEALDTRRKIIIGNLVSEYFPEVFNFEPHRALADNKVEFAPFENFLYMLAADKDLVMMLKERASIKM